MATLAAWYDRWIGKGEAQDDAHIQWAPGARLPRGRDTRLRPFTNDDVHFHVKRIDNSRVVREVDPQTPRVCWKLIFGAGVSAVLLIGLLLPTGYSLLAGYKIEDLRKQHRDLQDRMAELEFKEAVLLSPANLNAAAAAENLAPPKPGRLVHLSEESGVVARQRAAETPLNQTGR
jgi:hypothetical protein